MSHPDDMCHHGNADTSNEAFASVQPHLNELHDMVLAEVRATGGAGMCADECVARHPEVEPYTIRPRFTELRLRHRLIVLLATRRKNRNNKSEYTYVSLETARAISSSAIDPKDREWVHAVASDELADVLA